MPGGETNETEPKDQVRKRLVFNFCGFDPRGPSHYHKLYAEESAKQSRLNGLDLEIGKRRKVHRFSQAWEILEKNSETRTTYEFLRWDDLIRGHWPKNEIELIRATIPTYRAFFAANLIGKPSKFSRPFALVVTYPFVGFIGVLLFSALLLVVVLALTFSPWLPMWVGMIGVVAIPSGVDPLLMSGIPRAPGQPVRPIHKPMRIHKMFSKEDYAELKKDVFRLHFQYVMAGDLLIDYDYFVATAGPKLISERFPESTIL